MVCLWLSSSELGLHLDLAGKEGGVCCWPHHIWSEPIRRLRRTDGGWILSGKIQIVWFSSFSLTVLNLCLNNHFCVFYVCRSWTASTSGCSTLQRLTSLMSPLLWLKTTKLSTNMVSHTMLYCCSKRYLNTTYRHTSDRWLYISVYCMCLCSTDIFCLVLLLFVCVCLHVCCSLSSSRLIKWCLRHPKRSWSFLSQSTRWTQSLSTLER